MAGAGAASFLTGAIMDRATVADSSSMETVITTPQPAYLCYACTQPIAARTGVMAAQRLAAHEPASPLRMFGTPERCHVLCVPASYRLGDRF